MQAIDWRLIIEKHGPVVWQTAYRLLGNYTDAADCFQETFVSALEFCRRQRVRNFGGLLAHLATARGIDRLRQRSHQASFNTAGGELTTVPGENPGPGQQAEQEELADRLRDALSELAPQEAEVFCLRYLNDMSYRQIAKELRIKTNTAGVLLHRARVKLREHLEPAIQNSDRNEVRI